MNTNRSSDLAARYLAMNYPVSLRKLGPDEGGGWMACIPQLGSLTFVADGETAAEAVHALEELRQELIPQLVAEGVELPEPDLEEDLDLHAYSGKLALRIPKGLHGRVARAASRNECSINQLLTQFIAEGLGKSEIDKQMSGILEKLNDLDASRPQAQLKGRRSKWSTPAPDDAAGAGCQLIDLDPFRRAG